MLRAAIVEKSKEHREYIRASLTGINMDIQVSEYADEYDYLDDLNEDASSFDILLLNTTDSQRRRRIWSWRRRYVPGAVR